MKVSVVGPGSLGCLFAARLQDSGAKVTLIDYKKTRAEHLAKAGVTIETDDGTLEARPKVATSVPFGQDLILILTKAYATHSLELPAGVPVLTLQNGLGNVEALCRIVGSANVLAGATSEAATYLDIGRVRHAAPGVTKVGAWTSCAAEPARDVLKQAGFNVEITGSPGQTIWEKVVVSAGINPVSALLNVPNGRLLELAEPRKLIRDLVVEAAKVATTEGYRFDYSLVEETEKICWETATNISSMLQDVRAGRKTEIDAISREIVRRGEAASVTTPRTRVVYQLIKGLEEA